MANIAEWTLGDDTLIQRVWTDDTGDDEIVEMISGKEATEELQKFIEERDETETELIVDERGVFGFAYSDIMGIVNRVEFWDCDEESYSEYMNS